MGRGGAGTAAVHFHEVFGFVFIENRRTAFKIHLLIRSKEKVVCTSSEKQNLVRLHSPCVRKLFHSTLGTFYINIFI